MRWGLALGVSGLLAVGCGREAGRQGAPAELHTPVPQQAKLAPGAFRLAELERTPEGSVRYLAQADGDTVPCEFEIVMSDSKPLAGSSFTFGSASLVRRPVSDCSAFLKALAPMLGFKGALPNPKAASRLDMSVAVLGTNLSRGSTSAEVAGSFVPRPPGTWLATKLFLAEGEGEVFLNLSPPERAGEFSIKDEDYATIVVTELGRVLLPERRGA